MRVAGDQQPFPAVQVHYYDSGLDDEALKVQVRCRVALAHGTARSTL